MRFHSNVVGLWLFKQLLLSGLWTKISVAISHRYTVSHLQDALSFWPCFTPLIVQPAETAQTFFWVGQVHFLQHHSEFVSRGNLLSRRYVKSPVDKRLYINQRNKQDVVSRQKFMLRPQDTSLLKLRNETITVSVFRDAVTVYKLNFLLTSLLCSWVMLGLSQRANFVSMLSTYEVPKINT
jgi:hypothetical protein